MNRRDAIDSTTIDTLGNAPCYTTIDRSKVYLSHDTNGDWTVGTTKTQLPAFLDPGCKWLADIPEPPRRVVSA
jgi:hypothetical protein